MRKNCLEVQVMCSRMELVLWKFFNDRCIISHCFGAHSLWNNRNIVKCFKAYSALQWFRQLFAFMTVFMRLFIKRAWAILLYIPKYMAISPSLTHFIMKYHDIFWHFTIFRKYYHNLSAWFALCAGASCYVLWWRCGCLWLFFSKYVISISHGYYMCIQWEFTNKLLDWKLYRIFTTTVNWIKSTHTTSAYIEYTTSWVQETLVWPSMPLSPS